ncbi:MAG: CsgG/HfaB family protein [Armatimonas sp.]
MSWLLIDRSAPLPASIRESVERQTARRGDTIGWKEDKPGGGVRTFICGPGAASVEEVVRKGVAFDRLGEKATVLHSARDLTGVRRIAVSGLGRDPFAQKLADMLAGRTASGLRSLDAFEVLERDGLKNILAELALGQAGITKGADRARIRQLAAADALLIVDVEESNGSTDFQGRYERITPKMPPAPRRPLEPSRYKLPVETDHPKTRGLLEALAGRGSLKDPDDYREEMYYYQTRALPAWQVRMRDWERERRTRPVQWRVGAGASGTLSLRGSMRLVDLADGLVLWETPFETTEKGDQPASGRRTITTIGEDSTPGEPRGRDGEQAGAPDFLLSDAVDAVLEQAVGALKAGAILPSTLPAAESVKAQPAGKILDVDGDQLLIGLGASDDVAVGDTLRVRLESGAWVKLTVTRVRPRTCDARLKDGEDRTLRGRLVTGLGVERLR